MITGRGQKLSIPRSPFLACVANPHRIDQTMKWQQWVQRVRSVLSQRAPARRRAPSPARIACIEGLEDRSLLTINFLFDYSLDSQGFFNSPQARNLLEQAGAALGGRLNDSLLSINPGGGNSWVAQFSNPENGTAVGVSNLSIAANTLLIFVGSRDLTGGTVAESAPGGHSANGTSDWYNILAARGNPGAIPQGGGLATDFAPWGGSLAFDSSGTDWFLGSSINDIGADQMDFLSVAEHELGHLLGFGTSESFDRFISGSGFTGPNAVAAYDGPGNPPLSDDRAHWAPTTADGGQLAAMDPSLPEGTRRLFTGLDFAALKDIGWNTNPADTGSGGSGGQDGGSGTVIVTANPNMQTTESGGSSSFTVKLSMQPTANVVLNLSSSNLNEGNPSVHSLVFTPQNWNQAQTVTVTGVDDLMLDGSQTYKIIISPAVSSDSRFNGFDPPDVAVTNLDNDSAGIVVTPTSGLITTEQGGTSSFNVVLTSQPSANVTINLSSSNTQEGTISVSTLIFTPQNWLFPQTVTVTGVDDHVSDSSKTYTIITNAAISTDPAYARVNPADVSVMNISLPDLDPTVALSDSDTLAWSNGMPVLLDSEVRVYDPDSPFLNVAGAKLVLTLSHNGASGDRFSILNEGTGKGQVGNAAGSNNITYQGVVVATRSGGTGSSPLTITFNSNATLAIVQEVARNLQFRTSSTNRSALDRSISLKFQMPNGKTSVGTKVVHVVTGAAPPVINLGPSALQYTNRSGAQLISPTASLTDSDSLTFDGGKLTVQLAGGADPGDVLRIRRQGRGAAQIDAAQDGTVRFGTTIIGNWSGGTNGKALTVTLRSTASVAAVQALIRNITFETSATNTSLASRIVQFQVTDGDGGSSTVASKSITVS